MDMSREQNVKYKCEFKNYTLVKKVSDRVFS